MNDAQAKNLTAHQLVRLLVDKLQGNNVETVQQYLETLCRTLPLTVAGTDWSLPDGTISRIQWPDDEPADQWLACRETCSDADLDEPVMCSGGSIYVVPLRCHGQNAGYLWAACAPDQHCGELARDLLALTAGQLALAQQKTLLLHELEVQTERRAKLLQRIMHINEECRRHMARELHDEISQSLSALILQTDTIQLSLGGVPDPIPAVISKFRQELMRLQDEVQRLVLELRPALLEQKGLLHALRWYGRQRLQASGIEFHVTGGQCAPNLSALVRLTLYRIGQEAISNAARHAQASQVWLQITCQEGELYLTVRDNGCGFDSATFLSAPDGLKGLGLLGMQERALLLNGKFKIESSPGRGTCVQVRLPFEEIGIDDCYPSVAGR
ncbi:MAG: sensor histidine kinase [Caldilineaceae bacterium]|nr:sensor histidine kinase [Caldilineaceae bacterium]